MAMGYVAGRFEGGRWDWVANLGPSVWLPEHVATLALYLPFGRETWEFVSNIGEDANRIYWTRAMSEGHCLIQQDLEYAVSRLLQYSRPFQAIKVN